MTPSVPAIRIMSSNLYIFRRPKRSAMNPKKSMPMVAPAAVASLIAVESDESVALLQ